MSNLLQWIEEKLPARLRSGAAIRKNGPSRTNTHVVVVKGSERTKGLFFMFEAQQRPLLRELLAQGRVDRKKKKTRWCFVWKVSP